LLRTVLLLRMLLRLVVQVCVLVAFRGGDGGL
jgi:hypothetical protein